MKLTRIREGYYKTDSGYYIKSNGGKNIWTGRPMRPTFWYIYDGEVTGSQKWIGGGCTLREAREELKRITKG